MPTTPDAACAICDFIATAQPQQTVYQDQDWFAGVMDNIQIPGWIVLGMRRHALDPMGMNDNEAATFGPLLLKLSTAIKTALDAERVYVVGYGEHSQHWHVLLSSRDARVPAEHRHSQFWDHREKYVNPPAAEAAAARIRQALDNDSQPTEGVAAE